MADTTVNALGTQAGAELRVTQWQKRLRYEYVRDMKFRRLMGKSENAPIQMITELKKQPGDAINVPLITRLTGTGQTGDNVLRDNEEALGNYAHKITVDQVRHAVRRGHMEQKKTFFDLLVAGKVMLKKWAMNKMRDDILAAMYSPNVDGSTAYGSCTEAQKDAWLAANSDRVLFGALKSNNSSNDHSASLLNVDTTDDILSPTIISLMKRMMKTADRHVTPTQVGDQGEWFVLLCNPLCFRDLKNNSTMSQANRDGMARGKNNPIFVDGDQIWDGVIIKEVEEISAITGVGASSCNVSANFMLGAQAVGVAIGEELHAIKDITDYGNRIGAGVAKIYGVDKLMWNSIQNMGTLYCAAAADA